MSAVPPGIKQVGYNLPAELVRAIKCKAAEKDMPASRVVTIACTEYLARSARRSRASA